MKITQVRIDLPERENAPYLATADFVIDDAVLVTGTRIARRADGDLFLRMPTRHSRNGVFHNICHPINAQCRAMITDLILGEYEKTVEDPSLAGQMRKTGEKADALNITEVRITPYAGAENDFKGYASLTLDDAFVLRSIRLYGGGKDGDFLLSYPRYPLSPGENPEYEDYYRPVSLDAGAGIQKAVLDAYLKLPAGTDAGDTPA